MALQERSNVTSKKKTTQNLQEKRAEKPRQEWPADGIEATGSDSPDERMQAETEEDDAARDGEKQEHRLRVSACKVSRNI